MLPRFQSLYLGADLEQSAGGVGGGCSYDLDPHLKH